MPQTVSRLADFLPYLLAITADAVSDRIAQEYSARFGLRIPEWRVLSVLGDSGSLTQRDLVSATQMDKVAVNRAARSLEGRGLARRRPNDRDGRSHHLELTEEGKAMHAGIMPLALDMDERIFAALTTAQRHQLKTLLGVIRDSAKSLDAAALQDLAA